MSQEAELEVLKTVVSKIDQSLEKMTTVSNDIGKILAVHESRIDQLEKYGEDRFDDIKELHSRITTNHREMMDKINDMEKRMDDKFRRQNEVATEQHSRIQRELEDDIKDISKRIRNLENWKWWMMGVAAALGFIAAKIAPIMF